MKKAKLTSILVLLMGLAINAQELTCADFRIGEFFIPRADELKKYTITSKDSTWTFTSERDSTINRYVVIRKKNTQIEWKNGIGNGNPAHEIIEWIDECTYRLTYDSTKSELDEGRKWANDNNGIIVSKTKIEGKCLFYKATMNTNDGRTISQDGVICKE